MSKIKKALNARRSAGEMAIFAVVSKLPNHRIRIAALKLFGATLAPDVILYHGFQARQVRKLRIGSRTNIGDHAVLDARGGLSIGSDVNLSTGVQMWTAQHDWQSPDFGYVVGAIEIGDRVWLGPGVIVLPGTTIGEGVVVAAGAVAKGVLEPFTLYGGIPARPIGKRTTELTYRLPAPKQKTWWW